MNFQQKLKYLTKAELWNEYCGYLDLKIDEYMYIQNRLMEEQISMWRNSVLGKRIGGDNIPETVEEFRKVIPLTSYEDYADILFTRNPDLLPAEPIIWIETTWEGGLKPWRSAEEREGKQPDNERYL